MARSQEFDHLTVLNEALQVFWTNGFETTSVPTLEQATGLARSSIYNSFGSKKKLFDAVVNHYLATIIRPRLKPLTEPDVAPDALMDYLDGLRAVFADATSFAAVNGCLLLNSAGAPIGHDAAISAILVGYRKELRTAIHAGTVAAGSRDPDLTADTISGLVIASFTLARMSSAEAAAAISTAQELLRRTIPETP
ncbi:TetR/AcrR family transcriptional regulator [Corynebacterium pacaense]|uniref:TetR/AcrR family transcriptional regulator n=1 Tax=Corynebacterium pacaense TaxID=1816684 RepID=UPI0009BC546A|nr:TetR/AcrR family transcriptional regulator [Corynebacterium pacaense]